MLSAFILISSEVGAEDAILQELAKIKNVKEAYTVYGIYDIVCIVEADTEDQFRETIMRNIRNIEKVQSTYTLIIRSSK